MMDDYQNIFQCKRCGECCKGTGGIVLCQQDIENLRKLLGLDRESFLNRYTFRQYGKIKLKNHDDACVFFNNGCSVHKEKPNICKAWPFFKANIRDRISLEMAKMACPGINKNASFKNFASAGIKFINRCEIFAHNKNDPNSLFLQKDAAIEPAREKTAGKPD